LIAYGIVLVNGPVVQRIVRVEREYVHAPKRSKQLTVAEIAKG
jgi:hypothetical protein